MSQRASLGSKELEILSTHPHNASRIQDLRAYLPTARKLAAQYNTL